MSDSYEERVFSGERTYRDAEAALAAGAEVTALRGHSVCIIGCTGLIGTTLLRVLALANATGGPPVRVTGIARNAPAEPWPASSGIMFTQRSAGENDADDAPAADFTVYVAGAASDYLDRVNEVVQTQIVGLQKLLARSQGTRVCFISSARVYGRRDTPEPVGEAGPVHVIPMHLDNIYDSAKRLAESLCLWHTHYNACGATAVRLANLYGPQESVRADTAFTAFIRQAITERRIHVTGHPGSVRDYVHVLDAAQGILKSLVWGRPGEPYNIGSGKPCTVIEFARTVAAALPHPVAVHTSGTPPPAAHQSISIEKARTELGFAPVMRLTDDAPFAVARTARALGLYF